MSREKVNIEVISPSGLTERHNVENSELSGDGYTFQGKEIGTYLVSDGSQKVHVAMGSLNPIELRDIRTTEQVMKDITRSSGGKFFWLVEIMPKIRQILPGRDTLGKDWLGILNNNSVHVSGIKQTSLVPSYLISLFVLIGLLIAWWREGYSSSFRSSAEEK